jgi:hypothetical protein
MIDRVAAIARILQAAGECPSNLNPVEFWSALNRCVAGFRFRSTYGKASYLRARSDRFNAIRKHANELARLLEADEGDEDVIGDNWREILPRDVPSPRAFARILYGLLDKDLKHLRDESPSSLREHAAMMEKEFSGGVSAFEWLAGTALPSLFSKFFGEPRFSRTAQGPTGPFIHFALAIFKEFEITNKGKPYSAETVAAALTKARRGRPRRKGRTT